TLLHAHTYGLMTDGCMFATDPDAGKIILFKTLSVDALDADRLVQAVQDFRLVQRTWKRAYADGRLLTEPASGTAGAVPMGDLAGSIRGEKHARRTGTYRRPWRRGARRAAAGTDARPWPPPEG